AQNLGDAPIVVGHSMGGLLAQMLAAKIRPFALVLLTPATPAGIFPLRWANVWTFFFVLLRWGWWARPNKLTWNGFVTRAYNGVPAEKHRKLYEGMVEESGRVVLEMGMGFLDGQRAARVDTAAITCPVYIVSCGHDRLTPAPVVRKLAGVY